MTLFIARCRLTVALGFLVLAWSATSAWSQTNKPAPPYGVSVATDRPAAIYHSGETVTFEIKLTYLGVPVDAAAVKWMLSKDGVPPTTNGVLTLQHGAAKVTGKLDEPGFLQCRATFESADGQKFTGYGGAGVDPLQIKPSLPVPDDFDAFWSAQKEKLATIPVNPRLTAVKSNSDKVESFDVQADSLGAPVSGYFARPVGASPKSLPIILTVHGAGVVSSGLGGAVGWAKRGFLAVDLNAHGIPNGQPDKYYADLWAGELKDYPARGRESRETMYFLGMFLRLVRALDFLTAQPEWDGRTVIVHGSSQGGAQAIAAAGLDQRVTFFAAGVPAMCDHTGVIVGRVNGWPKLVPKGSDGKPDAKVLEAARYYDAVNFATRTRAAGIVTVGFIDGVCPPTSVYAAYNVLTNAKQIFNDPLAGHTVSPRASEAMREAIQAHVKTMREIR